ncbi:MAG: GntR family transcriptional regulator [Brevinema sp.]
MQYSNLSEKVYRDIKQQIVELYLKPGDKISEQMISEQFQISKTPSREALLKLAEEGLVLAIPYKGTFVTALCLQNIEDILFIRKTIERQVIKEFIELHSSEDLIRLDYLLKEQKSAMNDVHHFFSLDDQYHYTLYQATNHRNVYEMIQNLSVDYSRVRFLSLNSQKLEVLYQEHIEIYWLIQEHNIQKALDVFERHILKIYQDTQRILQNYPEYFRLEY